MNLVKNYCLPVTNGVVCGLPFFDLSPSMIRSSLCACCLFCAVLLISTETKAQWISYETRVIAQELNVPWEIRWGYDNWIWFTERSGRFSKVNPETGEKKVLLKVPFADHSDAEKGTLGFDFHPSFPDSPYLYIAYNYKTDKKSAYNVVRWTCLGDTLLDPHVILDNLPTGQIHNGSRVRVGPDRKLYVSTGEADIRELAQDTSSRSGKILRLELDGSIPADNPFAGNPIWSLGHRNPQGLEFGPTGLLYSTEHGPASDDELNLIEKGSNYGWPWVEGDCNLPTEQTACDSFNVKTPIFAWTPTVAVTGIQYCDQPTFPEWKNSILLATLKDQSLWILKLSDDGRSIIATYRYPLLYTEDGSDVRRLRDYCFSPDGRLFVSTSNIWSAQWNPDKIIEIKRIGTIPFEVIQLSPVNGSIVPTDQPLLVWAQTAGDSRYQIQIGTSIDVESEKVTDSTMIDTVLTVTLPASQKQYYWRVRELTSSGPWSVTDSFVVSPSSSVSLTERPSVGVYPNPLRAGRRLTVDLPDKLISGAIVDARGASLRQLSADELTSKILDLSWLATGTYFLSLELPGGHTQMIPVHVQN
jgi:glucose/arabinose dehydrogenase